MCVCVRDLFGIYFEKSLIEIDVSRMNTIYWNHRAAKITHEISELSTAVELTALTYGCNHTMDYAYH